MKVEDIVGNDVERIVRFLVENGVSELIEMPEMSEELCKR